MFDESAALNPENQPAEIVLESAERDLQQALLGQENQLKALADQIQALSQTEVVLQRPGLEETWGEMKGQASGSDLKKRILVETFEEKAQELAKIMVETKRLQTEFTQVVQATVEILDQNNQIGLLINQEMAIKEAQGDIIQPPNQKVRGEQELEEYQFEATLYEVVEAFSRAANQPILNRRWLIWFIQAIRFYLTTDGNMAQLRNQHPDVANAIWTGVNELRREWVRIQQQVPSPPNLPVPVSDGEISRQPSGQSILTTIRALMQGLSEGILRRLPKKKSKRVIASHEV